MNDWCPSVPVIAALVNPSSSFLKKMNSKSGEKCIHSMQAESFHIAYCYSQHPKLTGKGGESEI